jgi:hypothetical protein
MRPGARGPLWAGGAGRAKPPGMHWEACRRRCAPAGSPMSGGATAPTGDRCARPGLPPPSGARCPAAGRAHRARSRWTKALRSRSAWPGSARTTRSRSCTSSGPPGPPGARPASPPPLGPGGPSRPAATRRGARPAARPCQTPRCAGSRRIPTRGCPARQRAGPPASPGAPTGQRGGAGPSSLRCPPRPTRLHPRRRRWPRHLPRPRLRPPPRRP